MTSSNPREGARQAVGDESHRKNECADHDGLWPPSDERQAHADGECEQCQNTTELARALVGSIDGAERDGRRRPFPSSDARCEVLLDLVRRPHQPENRRAWLAFRRPFSSVVTRS